MVLDLDVLLTDGHGFSITGILNSFATFIILFFFYKEERTNEIELSFKKKSPWDTLSPPVHCKINS